MKQGEYVFYKSLNDDLSIYKVQKELGGDDYKLIQVNSDGGVTNRSKTFDSTLRNKSGDIRLFRIWAQPGDKVKMLNVLSGSTSGVVERYLVEQKPDKSYVNMLEVVSSDNKQHLYTFDQSYKQLELLG